MTRESFSMPGRGAAAQSVAGFTAGWLFGGRCPEPDPATTDTAAADTAAVDTAAADTAAADTAAADTADPAYDDTHFAAVTIPHTVTELGWLDWDPQDWSGRWIYRRHVEIPAELRAGRLFLGFEGALVGTEVWVNGVALPGHLGGYQPFGYEITDHVGPGDNVIAVVIDGDWHDVPPDGAPEGPRAVDYCQPAGIYRDVHLRSVPHAHLADVFAKPVDVLDPAARRVDTTVTVDAGAAVDGAVRIELRDGDAVVAGTTVPVTAAAGDRVEVTGTIDGLGGIELWDVDKPRLYDVVAILSSGAAELHEYRTRIGFRSAEFTETGFRLNGRRHQIIGLNRHQLYPYVGMAMPRRAQRKDAEILRTGLGCTMVRCAHYPQSPDFLDACDELGLMVWEEPPGWQYLPEDPAYHDLIVRDVAEMISRDRNHPAIVVWGVRVNESRNEPKLYTRTQRLAYELDGSRQTSGSMIYHSTDDWVQDVFGYDDYTGDGVDAGLKPPVPGVPYLLAEAVGALSAEPLYRRLDSHPVLARQAIAHAQVHDVAHSDERYSGLLGWVGFDYASQNGRIFRNLKTPGVVDGFRIPKYGAATYATSVDPARRAIVEPLFDWAALAGTDDRAALTIATNCDRLELSVDGKPVADAAPDRSAFPHLPHPPITVDLTAGPAGELRIDGYLGGDLAVTRRCAGDPSGDRIELVADDRRIDADGSDVTRLVFRAVDEHGNWRSDIGGAVAFTVDGPGVLVGPNPFDWDESPGAAAVWLRSIARAAGDIEVTASHAVLGRARVAIRSD